MHCFQLCIDGIRAFAKHAMIVTPEKENILWETKMIGDHSPLALPRARFCYVGSAVVTKMLKINSQMC